jgi:hypothetical protein
MAHVRAALALRARVLARRHATALDALLVAGTVALAAVLGARVAAARPGTRPAFVANAGLAALATLGAAFAHQLLYRAKELTLLLAQPISARGLVLVRFAELVAWQAISAAILAAFVGGLSGGARGGAPFAGAAVLAAAPLLAGASLLLAWSARRAVLVSLALPALVLALRPVSGPGEWFARLVTGEGGLALFPAAAALAGLALVLAPLGHGAAFDRLSVRPTRAPFWTLAGAATRLPALSFALVPLPRASAALVRRDLALLLRGGFTRGALVLLALPAGLLVFREAARDPTLEPWQGELAALMTGGVLTTIASFLFAIDFPRARAAKLVLERALPVRGETVLRARWFEGALPGVLLALALAAVAATGTPEMVDRAPGIALAGVLLAVAVSHHAACFGLRAEAEGAAAELAVAAGFPFAAATLVVLGAIALTIHPLLFVLYPLSYGRMAAPAARAWEHAEVLAPLTGSA